MLPGFLRVAESVEDAALAGTIDGVAANAGFTVEIGDREFVVAVLEIRLCRQPLSQAV